ncbi:hypothetical protein [Gephyromycinifex aptenodytis]|nr:hypothetical protein [Gephyromycinifex aptenodytis]
MAFPLYLRIEITSSLPPELFRPYDLVWTSVQNVRYMDIGAGGRA